MLCWVPPVYRPYSLDIGNVGSGRCNGFKVLGKNKVVLVQQHDFVVLHFPHVGVQSDGRRAN
ncbi:hypothetical protein CONPUDRAFT_170036 [Coniophora puteana RWD-64-598 SS2]|uniref:Uncharacterized protein n=1 Tax=Coniophora puteana (strain RWD-64-598) TaxID=741705 RepID=R7SI51_CONPW|nr:uncharacterized protein CONPUDRAFT_170036 [Coniophora puteana RWD-64-598 SS2]EIW74699.1 hypothetical protein CONPUDRAFT_170036 [Coniophora puteana RWD-64-598 SS2]